MYAVSGPLLACVHEAQQMRQWFTRPNTAQGHRSRPGSSVLALAQGQANSAVSSWPAVVSSTSPTLQSITSYLASPISSLLQNVPVIAGVARRLTIPHAHTAVAEATMRGLGTIDLDEAHSHSVLPSLPTPQQPPAEPFKLSDFLTSTDPAEVNYAALLSDLSDLAYDLHNVNAMELQQRHNLDLISTSATCAVGPQSRNSWQAGRTHTQEHQNGYHSTTTDVAAAVACQVLQSATGAQSDDSSILSSHRVSFSGSSSSGNSSPNSPTLTPTVSLVALSSVDESSSSTGQYPMLTFMPSAPQLAEGPSSPTQHGAPHVLDVTLPQGNSPACQVQVPVVQYSPAPASNSPQASALACGEPPAAWFCADDPVTRIRYIAIQGSTTLDHWQINLKFEPVIFESGSLGVRVHRGVYLAALQLYDDLLPLVRQHLATSPFASIAFTGHSLGGSLASLLMLLFVARGVLPPDCVSPVYTFGAPAIFCGGAPPDAAEGRCESCGLACEHAGHASPVQQEVESREKPACRASRANGLLAQLGLGEEHVINVIMHRDIVPRAFVCDYKLVADLLKQWMPALKDHSLLQGPAHAHKSLYNFLGRISLLQPDEGCSFVTPADAKHPNLPSAPGLYRMAAPAPRNQTPPSELMSARTPSSSKAKASGAPAPSNLKEAVQHFMNNPHPLTTLSEYGAYGTNGSISRYHNPQHYTWGLRSVVGTAPHQLLAASPVKALQLALTTAPALPSTCEADSDGNFASCDGMAELVSPDARRLLTNVVPITRKSQGLSRRTLAGLGLGMGMQLATLFTGGERQPAGSDGGQREADCRMSVEAQLRSPSFTAVHV